MADLHIEADVMQLPNISTAATNTLSKSFIRLRE